jgi:hypothetical protein
MIKFKSYHFICWETLPNTPAISDCSCICFKLKFQAIWWSLA